MAIRINRIRKTSPTATALSESLKEVVPNTKKLLIEGSAWRGKTNDLLINWGSSEPINVNARVFNSPEAVGNAVSKTKTFDILNSSRVRIPNYHKFTGDKDALAWFLAETAYNENFSGTFFFRTSDSGYGGSGIHIMTDIMDAATEFVGLDEEDMDEDEWYEYFNDFVHNTTGEWRRIIDNTKFVTEYFKATDEYRIHVMCGKVIFAQRKGLRTDDQRPENPNFMIRNHENGFIFQIHDITIPQDVAQQSIQAVQELGLDFGAVDIRYNPNQRKACVLEINTAPALTGSTLEKYTEVLASVHSVLQE